MAVKNRTQATLATGHQIHTQTANNTSREALKFYHYGDFPSQIFKLLDCYFENDYQSHPQRKALSDVNSNSKDLSKDEATLLVGTKPGHLLVYKVECFAGSNRLEVNLERMNRSFSKRPIQQLFASFELKILISLSDGLVSVHDLTTFQVLTTVQKTKGAIVFSADLEEQTSSTGDVAYALKLCVAVKRKLQFYFWKNRDFFQLHEDITLPESPKCMSWCKDSVCLGFKRDYCLVKLDKNDSVKDLFPTGKLQEPVVGRLDVDQLVLMKDDMSVFIDNNGEPTYTHSFPWSDNPLAVVSQPPYLIAILPKYMEVRTIEPRMLIQSMDFQKPRHLTVSRDWIFVASTNRISAIHQRPVAFQIDQLLRDREFELALKLAKMSNDGREVNKEARIRQIRTSLAFELFCQLRFSESLHNFAELRTDPVQVIGLYPDLLPLNFQKTIKFPSEPPTIKGLELEKSLHALIELLTQKRNETLKQTSPTIDNVFPIVKGMAVVTSRKQLLTIIDTTLLKCYLKTNDALVAPLLRLPDNHCHVEEAERLLKSSSKHRELLEFYRSKGLHAKALSLLQHQAEVQPDKEDIQEDMIEYLQHMGGDDIKLIFEYAGNLLKSSPVKAMKIFTGDTAEVDSLPTSKVFTFLDNISSNLVVSYLEHLIFTLNDTREEFHTRLACEYRNKVIAASEEFRNSLPEDDKLRFENAPVEVSESSKKLLTFLDRSIFYDPEHVLHGFPTDGKTMQKNTIGLKDHQMICSTFEMYVCRDYLTLPLHGGFKFAYFSFEENSVAKAEGFFHERALLLGRKGNHQQAIDIYVNILHDHQRAERFCLDAYSRDPFTSNEIFIHLLAMYIGENSSHSVERALNFMHLHHNKFDAEKAISLLPDATKVYLLDPFLHNVLESLAVNSKKAQLLKSLLLSENQQVHEQRIFRESARCVITDERVCRLCRKKIGVSAFARYPNDVVVHYFCCKDKKVQPLYDDREAIP